MSSQRKANTRKVSVGIMPNQKEDYSEYEQTEVLWGRIALIFASVFGTVFIALYALFYPAHNNTETASILEERQLEERTVHATQGLSDNSSDSRSDSDVDGPFTTSTDSHANAQRQTAEQQILTSNKAPESAAVVAAIEEVAGQIKPGNAAKGSAVTSADAKVGQSPLTTREEINLLTVLTPKPSEAKAVVNTSDALISPVSTLHPGILVASLAKGIDAKRQPVGLLGYQVEMNNQDLIKVVLYTEMLNIRGVTLYHEWYQGDKRHAKVRIPVTVENQASFSSKYIDRHMMGEWTVRVRDEQGEMYAMANFNVVK